MIVQMRPQNGVTGLCWSPNPVEKHDYVLTQKDLNHALIRPVHRGATVSGIFPKLTHA